MLNKKGIDNQTSEHAAIFLEHVLHNIPQYVFWKDIHSVYLGCNQNYAWLIGLSNPKEIIGKTDLDIGCPMVIQLSFFDKVIKRL